jgi:hypothetical protein
MADLLTLVKVGNVKRMDSTEGRPLFITSAVQNPRATRASGRAGGSGGSGGSGGLAFAVFTPTIRRYAKTSSATGRNYSHAWHRPAIFVAAPLAGGKRTDEFRRQRRTGRPLPQPAPTTCFFCSCSAGDRRGTLRK